MVFVEILVLMAVIAIFGALAILAVPLLVFCCIMGIVPFAVTVQNLDGSESVRTYRSVFLIKEEIRPSKEFLRNLDKIEHD